MSEPSTARKVVAGGCGLYFAGQMAWAGVGAAVLSGYFRAYFDQSLGPALLLPIVLGGAVGLIGGSGVRRAILSWGQPRTPGPMSPGIRAWRALQFVCAIGPYALTAAWYAYALIAVGGSEQRRAQEAEQLAADLEAGRLGPADWGVFVGSNRDILKDHLTERLRSDPASLSDDAVLAAFDPKITDQPSSGRTLRRELAERELFAAVLQERRQHKRAFDLLSRTRTDGALDDLSEADREAVCAAFGDPRQTPPRQAAVHSACLARAAAVPEATPRSAADFLRQIEDQEAAIPVDDPPTEADPADPPTERG